jgi:hypothetical protein
MKNVKVTYSVRTVRQDGLRTSPADMGPLETKPSSSDFS